ncbi:hypothetical protein QN277_019846 [Acacia crassicarpa]|uniref:WAT1-related protein n=1 Tax=Acacia crassicarpa TaxID=499986 RepID=A0AAE1MS56_9FABA|nr:hypothetical protein QN277_019846 [Acacia crassicarpa]
MGSIRNMLKGLKSVVLMVMVQIALAGVNLAFKFAINDGMSMRIATAYRLIFASAFTLPLAFLIDRKKRPKLTWRLIYVASLSGLFGGSLVQNLYFEAVALTSATLVSAIYNLNSPITFIMAVLLGLERWNLGAAGGKAKVLGSILGISGAALLTFFKGFEIHIWSTHINLLHSRYHHDQNDTASHEKHFLGVLFAILSCFSFALWLIVQTSMGVECPSYLFSAALTSTMGAMQATLFALCIERDWKEWKLGWNVRLLTVSYAGIFTSGLVVIAIAWCVKMRGPTYTSMFQPLMLVIVAMAASLTLNEKLYLGSLLGAFLIVCGLYIVIWGKNQEMKMKEAEMEHLKNTQQQEEKEPEPIEVVVFNKVHDRFGNNNVAETTSSQQKL